MLSSDFVYVGRQLCFIHIWLVFVIAAPGQVLDKNTRGAELENVAERLNKFLEPEEVAGSEKVLDSISKKGDREKTEFARYYLIFRRSRQGRRPEDFLENLKKMQPVLAAYSSPTVKAVNKFFLGDFYFRGNVYGTGLDLMLEARSEFETIGYENIPLLGEMFYILGNHYYAFGSYETSIHYARLSVQFRDRGKMCTPLNTWGLAHQKLEQYEAAIRKFQQAIEAAKDEGKPEWVAIASGNLGRTYCLQKDFKKGIPLLYQDVMANRGTDAVNSALSALYICDAYIIKGVADSARHYLHLAATIFTTFRPWGSPEFYETQFAERYYSQLAKLEELNRDYYLALKHADTANALRDQHRRNFDLNILASSEKRLQGLEYQKNLEIIASEKKNQKRILLVVLFAIVTVSVVLISRQRLKIKKERQLAAAKEANLLLRQQQAEAELENSRQQLETFMSNIAEKNKLIEKITSELEIISARKTEESRDEIDSARKQLYTASLLTNDEWMEFKVRFEKVYAGFFVELAQAYPEVTPAEERVLALTKLNIDNKQIGNMLGISPASVRTAKYRLRKKLQHNNVPLISLLLTEES